MFQIISQNVKFVVKMEKLANVTLLKIMEMWNFVMKNMSAILSMKVRFPIVSKMYYFVSFHFRVAWFE